MTLSQQQQSLTKTMNRAFPPNRPLRGRLLLAAPIIFWVELALELGMIIAGFPAPEAQALLEVQDDQTGIWISHAQ